jgi:prepilin-type N-terminal cleavage/methylation domain-containing protein
MRRAFTLIELLVVVSVVVLLISLALPGLSRARRSAQTTLCQANMRQIGTLASSYAGDNRELLHGFSWRSDLAQELNNAQFDRQAHAIQATWLLRQLLGDPSAPLNINWWPSNSNAHLVLAQYADLPLPYKAFVCPSDTSRIRWLRPEAFEEDLPAIADALSIGVQPAARRYRIGSSYKMTAATSQPDIGPYALRPFTNQQYNTSSDHPKLRLGRRLITHVEFPSQKVWMFDEIDRHSSRVTMFYAEPEAAQPLLMFDGSVSMRKFADANISGDPTLWQSGGPTGRPPRVTIQYQPIPVFGDPPRLRPTTPGGYDTKFWYTRGGLRGIDYGGDNVRTWNWTP